MSAIASRSSRADVIGLCAAAVLVVAVAAGLAGAASARASLPRATLVTDSVGGVLFWYHPAREELERRFEVKLETATCRRLVDEGCYAYGQRPVSALEVVRGLGKQAGPIVVIDVGYNDAPDGYADGLDRVMRALAEIGVEHVVWVTLRESRPAYVEINQRIRDGARRWPQLVIADWNDESRGHDWFADDVHMTAAGGVAFARFLRPILLEACAGSCDAAAPSATKVVAATPGRLLLTPATLGGGGSAVGRLALAAPAPPGGIRCSLGRSSRALRLPGSVMFTAGASSVRFVVRTRGVDHSITGRITARCGGDTVGAQLTVLAPVLASLRLPASVQSGSPASGSVRLSSQAGPGGVHIALDAGSAQIRVPATVVVPGGASAAPFAVETDQVTAATGATVEADWNGTSLVAAVRLEP